MDLWLDHLFLLCVHQYHTWVLERDTGKENKECSFIQDEHYHLYSKQIYWCKPEIFKGQPMGQTHSNHWCFTLVWSGRQMGGRSNAVYLAPEICLNLALHGLLGNIIGNIISGKSTVKQYKSLICRSTKVANVWDSIISNKEFCECIFTAHTHVHSLQTLKIRHTPLCLRFCILLQQ